MLITFRCRSYSNVTMFGDIGLEMIKMMGHRGTVPSSLSAQEVPEALSKLTAAIASKKLLQDAQDADNEEDEQEEQTVSFDRRAFPLIALLKSAIEDECDVSWDKG
ncbi:uncharacterized protein DUF1840 [Vibrio sp. ES.051]|uniref:DUF1840 domain-containing protein n=1 Tax=Vibrio sp. ES.051 TaxID=1761909 RepID=UPI000BFA6A21|nr:DUF1840 domain-containing protein [Vibrio sp. ES.051]PFG57985.1 uncharacterized protein DUF1840 [Vibrio sp. ES.051]